MEKVLQELFWAPIPFKRYQNISGCGTVIHLTMRTVSDRTVIERLKGGILEL